MHHFTAVYTSSGCVEAKLSKVTWLQRLSVLFNTPITRSPSRPHPAEGEAHGRPSMCITHCCHVTAATSLLCCVGFLVVRVHLAVLQAVQVPLAAVQHPPEACARRQYSRQHHKCELKAVLALARVRVAAVLGDGALQAAERASARGRALELGGGGHGHAAGAPFKVAVSSLDGHLILYLPTGRDA